FGETAGLGHGAQATPPFSCARADGAGTRAEPKEARQARQPPPGALEGATAAVHRCSILLTRGGGLDCYHSRQWWQNTRWLSLTRSSGGGASAQSAVALGQRVRNRQPLGGSKGDGRSPVSITRGLFASRSGSGIGTAEISACV